MLPEAALGAKERSSLVLVLFLVLDLLGNSITRKRTRTRRMPGFSLFEFG
jgi:hypothetical protein